MKYLDVHLNKVQPQQKKLEGRDALLQEIRQNQGQKLKKQPNPNRKSRKPVEKKANVGNALFEAIQNRRQKMGVPEDPNKDDDYAWLQ